MRLQTLFTKTRRENPADEQSKNAILFERAGYVHKNLAGVYSFLPLGNIVLQNIVSIIRKEMVGLGAQEVSLSALQDKEVWKKTDRWDDEKVDNWFKTTFKSGGETGLGITHEEPLTNLMRDHISSYRDLPRYVFQFQTKFRNEARAKSGIMRGKEFLMKDLYSFSKTVEEHDAFYAQVRAAYIRIFDAVGLGEVTYPTFASGGIFSKFSEEFQTITDAGEDTIYVDSEKKVAVNKEVYTDEVLAELGLSKDTLKEIKAVEVGNIFNLGTKFSDPLGLTYTDESGERKPVVMGSYGIGPGRLMGTIVEVFSDDKGIVWPSSVAPARVHIVQLGTNEEVVSTATNTYNGLISAGVTTILDDRDLRPGEKLSDAELMGMPHILIISEKSLKAGGIEYRNRKTGETQIIGTDISAIADICV
jgi:prolyl-tRNA synthetase